MTTTWGCPQCHAPSIAACAPELCARRQRENRGLLHNVREHRVLRGADGCDYVWVFHGTGPMRTYVPFKVLNRLFRAGLVALPPGSGERYWEPAGKLDTTLIGDQREEEDHGRR